MSTESTGNPFAGTHVPSSQASAGGTDIYIQIDDWLPLLHQFRDAVGGAEGLQKLIAEEPSIASMQRRVMGETDILGNVKKKPLDPSLPYWLLGAPDMTARTWKDDRISSWADALAFNLAPQMHERRKGHKVENFKAWTIVFKTLKEKGLLAWLTKAEAQADELLAQEAASIEAYAELADIATA